MILGNKVIQAFPGPVRRAMKPLLLPLFRKLEGRRLIRLYSGFVSPGDLVFDVGAHTGAMAEVLLGLGARVVCIDPQPACVKALQEKYGKHPKVAIEAVGVGAQPGELEFSICSQGPQVSSFAQKWKEGRFSGYAWDEKILVPVTTLDALIGKHGLPRFCKIDVEGFEIEVLKGLNRQVPFVSFEFTREFLPDAETCMDHLQSLGPARFQVCLYTRFRFALPDWVGSKEMMGFLRGIPDADLCGDIYVKSPA